MRVCAGLLFGWLVAVCPALAQDAQPEKKEPQPIALLGARVAGIDGPVNILISKGKIRAIDPRARPLPGMLRVNLNGARVAPGRIDAFSSLGQPDPRGSALDAFDPYDRAALERALAGGVTSAIITPLRSGGISGTAAAIKLKPSATLEERTLVEEAAVCTSIGLGSDGPSKRAGAIASLRKQFLAAQAYQDAWLDYEEALEKYGEELKKAPKKDAKKPAPKKPAPKGKKPPKKKKGPTKPKQPRRDSAKALLVRVLDLELPVRIEAHRVADIVNALELQEEFGFRLILEGATESHLIAEAIAARKVPVILGPQSRSDFTKATHPLRLRNDCAARLHAAGVELAFGCDWWTSTPYLALNARLAVGAGLDPEVAEDAVTHGVARMLGLGDRLGKVAVGYDADLIVVRDDPLGVEDVRAVLIDGEIVYRKQQQ